MQARRDGSKGDAAAHRHPGKRRRAAARRLAPNAVTMLRPVFGAFCGIAVYLGDGTGAMWWFLLGYLTDVVDGLLARAFGVASAEGRRLDGMADLAFSTSFGIGLGARALQEGDLAVLLVLGLLLVGALTNGMWLRSHSALGKAMAGLYRIVWFLLLWTYVPVSDRPRTLTIAIMVATATYVYEAFVTYGELKSGSRSFR